jgi:uncharacterized surface protein with fasciclin (FAS1) repeats
LERYQRTYVPGRTREVDDRHARRVRAEQAPDRSRRHTCRLDVAAEREHLHVIGGTGPLTVFAPSDDAFASLAGGTVEALLKDVPKLKALLAYHVVAGKVHAADVLKAASPRRQSTAARSRSAHRGG